MTILTWGKWLRPNWSLVSGAVSCIANSLDATIRSRQRERRNCYAVRSDQPPSSISQPLVYAYSGLGAPTPPIRHGRRGFGPHREMAKGLRSADGGPATTNRTKPTIIWRNTKRGQRTSNNVWLGQSPWNTTATPYRRSPYISILLKLLRGPWDVF